LLLCYISFHVGWKEDVRLLDPPENPSTLANIYRPIIQVL
jgi:hypothetical protein